MTTCAMAEKKRADALWARRAVAWLAFAASPAFALMAWITAEDASRTALCGSGARILPIDGMTAMYLLMSLFHLSPWLGSLSGRPRRRT